MRLIKMLTLCSTQVGHTARKRRTRMTLRFRTVTKTTDQSRRWSLLRLGRPTSGPSLSRGLIATRLILMATIGAALGFPQTLPPLSSNATVFASGFNNPRGLKFGPDGVLYVAEGGTGGTEFQAARII